ncbi:hypothetical protein NP233_g12090 [Leucocoprinus birnbaumii]|uniref:Uncharacterized protein n=1 Tax=Leucocoprinus birnbaumii TaxID=56174 RepID=A0AAD5VKU3_9AGAR|nr:hypothetical protein NP233_g12090 [Leucocoprinus birnbaumii]
MENKSGKFILNLNHVILLEAWLIPTHTVVEASSSFQRPFTNPNSGNAPLVFSLQRPFTVPKPRNAPQVSESKKKKRHAANNGRNAANAASRVPVPARAFPRFNDLPIELQEGIFKIAAHGAYEERVRALMDVSPKVKEWTEPFLYTLIGLPCCSSEDDEMPAERDQSKIPFYQALLETKPKEFFAKSVRHLYTDSRGQVPHYQETELRLLAVCGNLEVLECWSKGPNEELTAMLMTTIWPRLKMLGINIDLFLPKHDHIFDFPLFQNVTHLDLKSETPLVPAVAWKSLKSLSNLTHMRINTMEAFKWNQKDEAADHAYAMAKEVRAYLPTKLKHFVILIPVDVLYNMWTEMKVHGDEKRWRRVQSIRLGRFSQRIMLGCVLDRDVDMWMESHHNFEYDAPDYEDLGEFGESWLYTTPIIFNPTHPVGRYAVDERYHDWVDVGSKNCPGARWQDGDVSQGDSD